LELEQIRSNLEEYRRLLEKMGLPHDFFRLADAPVIKGSDKGLFEALVAMMSGDREIKREQASLRRMVLGTHKLQPMARQILPLADRYCEERQWMARYHELRGLMSGWRFLHRWIAILLLSAVTFHIIVAFRMGNLWLADDLDRFFHSHYAVAPAHPAVTPAVAPRPTQPAVKHRSIQKKHKNRHRHP
jgi:hypothetical protein